MTPVPIGNLIASAWSQAKVVARAAEVSEARADRRAFGVVESSRGRVAPKASCGPSRARRAAVQHPALGVPRAFRVKCVGRLQEMTWITSTITVIVMARSRAAFFIERSWSLLPSTSTTHVRFLSGSRRRERRRRRCELPPPTPFSHPPRRACSSDGAAKACSTHVPAEARRGRPAPYGRTGAT